jgi:indolepyruvate ferredoxin oxidoreductase
MEQRIAESCGETGDRSKALFLDAQALALKLMGDAIFANTLLLGVAWQRGLVPVSLAALDKAFELNGTAVDKNRRAFLWGRRAAFDLDAVRRFAQADQVEALPKSLDAMIAERVAMLTDYQDAAYGERYRSLVARVRVAEQALGSSTLTEAVARYYFKLLAIKDEYEVARLYTDPAFMQRIRDTFDGDYRLNFHLAPPMLTGIDPNTGHPRKRAYGAWTMRAFGLLAKLRFLRGSALDVFGNTDERRMERQLIANYEADVARILECLNNASLADAVALASLPERIRGFGHIKAASVASAALERERLRASLGLDSSQAAAA